MKTWLITGCSSGFGPCPQGDLWAFDPAAREFILRTILTNYNENGTVLISTHLILDVEQVLDEAVFLQQGQVVLHESTDSIRERTGGSVDELFRNMFRAPVMGNGGEYNAR